MCYVTAMFDEQSNGRRIVTETAAPASVLWQGLRQFLNINLNILSGHSKVL